MKRGFTLIEMLVSVAMFAVVMVIALGALLAMSTADRRAESLKSVINNLDFAMDSVSRTVRTGSGWGCPTVGTDCQNGGNQIILTAAGGATVEYRLDTTNASLCGQNPGSVGCVERSLDSGTTWLPITAPEVVITEPSGTYLFSMLGSKAGALDNVQPKLVITLAGYVSVTAAQQSQFRVQTTVTQRIYDQ